jgi:hypothetical protein
VQMGVNNATILITGTPTLQYFSGAPSDLLWSLVQLSNSRVTKSIISKPFHKPFLMMMSTYASHKDGHTIAKTKCLYKSATFPNSVTSSTASN